MTHMDTLRTSKMSSTVQCKVSVKTAVLRLKHMNECQKNISLRNEIDQMQATTIYANHVGAAVLAHVARSGRLDAAHR